MTKLRLWDEEFGLMEREGKPVVSSRYVAQVFEKEHKNVLESIRNIIESKSVMGEEFGRLNFRPSSYKNAQNKNQPEYLLTRDGFTILVMGFTGEKAMEFKIAYINRFNDMESYLASLVKARMECPSLTQAIQDAHETPKHYHFSNEFDMINRIAVGMNAKQFRLSNSIPDGESIRPYLTDAQVYLIERLQHADVGMVMVEPDFTKRKYALEHYCNLLKKKQKQLTA